MKLSWKQIISLLASIVVMIGLFAACGDQKKENEEKKEAEPALNGFVEEEGVRYYYSNGEKLKNTIVGDETQGYFYAGETGAIDLGYCNGVNVDGTDWIVIEGAAYKTITESDKCLFKAAQDIAQCTDSSMTREEKLKKSFDYIKEHYLEGVLHDPPYEYTKIDWPIVCANDLFVYGKGDCYSYGAAYAYMARAIGYKEVYACNSGSHGWAEVENKTYDPEWSLHSDKYTYFGIGYDEECDVPYSFAISDNADYKRLKIEINGGDGTGSETETEAETEAEVGAEVEY